MRIIWSMTPAYSSVLRVALMQALTAAVVERVEPVEQNVGAGGVGGWFRRVRAPSLTP
jgi:hypothetical protein